MPPAETGFLLQKNKKLSHCTGYGMLCILEILLYHSRPFKITLLSKLC